MRRFEEPDRDGAGAAAPNGHGALTRCQPGRNARRRGRAYSHHRRAVEDEPAAVAAICTAGEGVPAPPSRSPPSAAAPYACPTNLGPWGPDRGPNRGPRTENRGPALPPPRPPNLLNDFVPPVPGLRA